MDDHQLKNAIKTRFRDLSFKKGIRRITTDILARECGISKKTLYRLFHSKDELIDEILEDILSEYRKGVAAIDAGVKNPLEKLYRLIELPFALFGDISTPLVQDVTLLYPHIEKRLNEIRDNHRVTVMKTFVNGVREGYFKDINPSFIVAFLSGAGRQVMNSAFILENNMTIRQIFTDFRDIMLSGLLKQGWTSAQKKIRKKQHG